MTREEAKILIKFFGKDCNRALIELRIKLWSFINAYAEGHDILCNGHICLDPNFNSVGASYEINEIKPLVGKECCFAKDNSLYCSLEKGHAGPHVATDTQGAILRCWNDKIIEKDIEMEAWIKSEDLEKALKI